jgi:hypothetical protein
MWSDVHCPCELICNTILGISAVPCQVSFKFFPFYSSIAKVKINTRSKNFPAKAALVLACPKVLCSGRTRLGEVEVLGPLRAANALSNLRGHRRTLGHVEGIEVGFDQGTFLQICIRRHVTVASRVR